MAQSFLPFCAHCEQQINIPNTTFLYCSEKCKRKDQAKITIPTTSPQQYNPYLYSMTPPPSQDHFSPPRNYVKPANPTPPYERNDYSNSSNYSDCSDRDNKSPTIHHSHESETMERSSSSRSILSNDDHNPLTSPSFHTPTPTRPQHLRAKTSSNITTLSSLNTTPYSPTTAVPVPSSYTRPLPPLHRPNIFSTSPRSIDLVTPYMPMTSPKMGPGSPKIGSLPPGSLPPGSPINPLSPGSPVLQRNKEQQLKTLFDFEAIRGGPEPGQQQAGGYEAKSPPGWNWNYGVYQGRAMAQVLGERVILKRMSPTVAQGGWGR
ncbi:hypothetical protein BZA77DRAFT_50699 [Pyronema omphalodes]|nr:hypothetical protein BZA77DRAFT_50699 [Pyronema omphalodes]